jgi:carbonic anhydrase
MNTTKKCLLFVVLVGLTAAMAAAQSWNHDPNSPIGPNRWGFLGDNYNSFATCGSIVDPSTLLTEVGKKQTPVNVVSAEAITSVLQNIDFRYHHTSFVVENTGHVVEVPYENGSQIRIGPGLPDKYKLLQFHFHAPSEHTIDGKLADAELHLVHQNALGELAVVGVLLQIDNAHANPLFDTIMFGAPLNPGHHHLHAEINAEELLPESPSYYTYTGSLTTPPCTEGVHWFVMDQAVGISRAAVARLHLIVSMFPNYRGYPNNNRPVRPLNGRAVLFKPLPQ